MSIFPPATAEELAFAKAHARPKNSFEGCSRSTEWEVLGKLGEGTFGEVHRARNRKTGLLVAMKKIIMHNERDGFPITALREIRLLKMLSHPNILKLEDMSIEPPPVDKKKRPNMYMITPYMDHDLAGLLENPDIHLTVPQIKCYMLQLLEGLRYLHDSLILHRDMKAANLLINNKGILQIADFGLARKFQGSPPEEGKPYGDGKAHYTGLVVTRWYRPPELLLQLRNYTPAIDVWGVGCVFGEMLTGKPILPGESDGNQLEIIWDLVGTPTDSSMPGWRTLPGAQGLMPRSRPGNLNTKFKQFGAPALSLLTELLRLDWRTRINAVDALKHPYFKQDPLPARPSELPIFEESHELDRKKFKDRRKAGGPPAVSHGVPNGGARHDGPRRLAWERGERGLPARPPEQVDANRFSRDYDRGERPRDREGRDYRHGRGQDRYVPDYGNGSGGGGGRRDWDRDHRDRDRARDRDRGSRDGGSRDGRERDYRRDDWRRRDGREGNRRTRSRSPTGYSRDSYRR